MRLSQIWMVTLLLAAAMASAGWTAAPAASPADPVVETTAAAMARPVPPSFQPGARVVLALKLQAPQDWGLNYLVPIRLQFDKEYLKTAPFKVDQAIWDTTIESYLPEYIIEIPVVLDTRLADQALTIPIDVQCSICESTGEQCTFCMETLTVKLQVKRAPAEGDGANQALAQGTLEYSYRLSLP